ncbi:Ttc8 [Scenedesmus sp. PABB004]|nr:Ttc8 [Scenedesmus sp. PABB004]
MVCDAHPLWLAHSRLRRRRFDDAAALCGDALRANPLDQVAWYLKVRALTLQAWVDDTEEEEAGLADALLDEHAVATVARPGTSLARPATGAQGGGGGGLARAMRPSSAAGRPLTGFARPGSAAPRPGSGAPGAKPGTALAAALRGGARPGTGAGRPLTSSGRRARRAGAPRRAAPRRAGAREPAAARRPAPQDHNMRKALELAAAATAAAGFGDWWWKDRLGRAYAQLGLLRDAEKQLASAAKTQDMVAVVHQRAKVSLRLDQPLAALALFEEAAARHPGDVSLVLGQVRVQEALGRRDEARELYEQVLRLDASNVEAIACLAAEHFYSDQPELALRYYRRLLQMGVVSAEVWTNLGLSCFYAGQYDLVGTCLERGLALADDGMAPGVWYNVGQVALGIGDLAWAEQCFRVAAALQPGHGEALNNLAVLAMRRGRAPQAAAHLHAGAKAAPHVYELRYNAALLAHRQGDLQEALEQVDQALQLFPDHADSLELKRQLRAQLTALAGMTTGVHAQRARTPAANMAGKHVLLALLAGAIAVNGAAAASVQAGRGLQQVDPFATFLDEAPPPGAARPGDAPAVSTSGVPAASNSATTVPVLGSPYGNYAAQQQAAAYQQQQAAYAQQVAAYQQQLAAQQAAQQQAAAAAAAPAYAPAVAPVAAEAPIPVYSAPAPAPVTAPAPVPRPVPLPAPVLAPEPEPAPAPEPEPAPAPKPVPKPVPVPSPPPPPPPSPPSPPPPNPPPPNPSPPPPNPPPPYPPGMIRRAELTNQIPANATALRTTKILLPEGASKDFTFAWVCDAKGGLYLSVNREHMISCGTGTIDLAATLKIKGAKPITCPDTAKACPGNTAVTIFAKFANTAEQFEAKQAAYTAGIAKAASVSPLQVVVTSVKLLYTPKPVEPEPEPLADEPAAPEPLAAPAKPLAEEEPVVLLPAGKPAAAAAVPAAPAANATKPAAAKPEAAPKPAAAPKRLRKLLRALLQAKPAAKEPAPEGPIGGTIPADLLDEPAAPAAPAKPAAAAAAPAEPKPAAEAVPTAEPAAAGPAAEPAAPAEPEAPSLDAAATVEELPGGPKPMIEVMTSIQPLTDKEAETVLGTTGSPFFLSTFKSTLAATNLTLTEDIVTKIAEPAKEFVWPEPEPVVGTNKTRLPLPLDIIPLPEDNTTAVPVATEPVKSAGGAAAAGALATLASALLAAALVL